MAADGGAVRGEDLTLPRSLARGGHPEREEECGNGDSRVGLRTRDGTGMSKGTQPSSGGGEEMGHGGGKLQPQGSSLPAALSRPSFDL